MIKEDLRLYFRLLDYLKPYRLRLFLAVLAMLGVSGFTALLAYMVKPILDEVFVARRLEMIYILPPLVVILYLAKDSFAFFHIYQMSYIGTHIIATLREQLYRAISRQSMAFFDHQATGDLMSRITYDVTMLQLSVTSVVTSFFKDSFTVVGLVAVIIFREWRLALMALAVYPLAVVLMYFIGKRVRRISTKTQAASASLYANLTEALRGQRIVKAFVREDYEAERFNRTNQEFVRLQVKAVTARELSSPVMEVLASFGMAGIMGYGGYNVIMGYSSPGTFFSFLAALLMLYPPIKSLSRLHNVVQEGLAAAQRVFALRDRPPDIQDRPGAVALPPISRNIIYQGVSFSYDDRPVLQDINLTVHRGEMIALVGPSGAGKTTLLNLLPRFYEVERGAIFIDGRDIRDVTQASLRGQIGVVTQQTILFNDTVRHNVAYGRLDASESQILEALRMAYACDFVMAMPRGLDTLIGEQGVRLSGGERQRLAIARALLKDAPILILDEATSSLDSESEREVQQALDRLIAGRTTLVIAHRLSTVRNAHRLIVLDQGRIVEQGTHEALLKLGGVYHRLYEMQFAREESEISPSPAQAALVS
ncbi:MAG: lipid A export permease/ATP-binding protein MsbA [Deltaproteobacteria bacterium]|nr:lipid A export permease/ATP-binding protein MsbA [Deltaproteobacteria bacterium]